MSKGDKQRPLSVPRKEFNAEYDRIFRKKPVEKSTSTEEQLNESK